MINSVTPQGAEVRIFWLCPSSSHPTNTKEYPVKKVKEHSEGWGVVVSHPPYLLESSESPSPQLSASTRTPPPLCPPLHSPFASPQPSPLRFFCCTDGIALHGPWWFAGLFGFGLEFPQLFMFRVCWKWKSVRGHCRNCHESGSQKWEPPYLSGNTMLEIWQAKQVFVHSSNAGGKS